MTAYTDYPFYELNDEPGKEVPIRRVEVLSYDGNKYCLVRAHGILKEIKAGYLYKESGRWGEVECIDKSVLKRFSY